MTIKRGITKHFSMKKNYVYLPPYLLIVDKI